MHTRLLPKSIFPSFSDYLAFTRPVLLRQVLQTVVERALAHPADYQSLTAHLQSDIALLAEQAGMSRAARQLQALCTDHARSLCDAIRSQDTAPRSMPRQGSAGTARALQASSAAGSLYSSRFSSIRNRLFTLRDALALAVLRALYRDAMTDAQAVKVLMYRTADSDPDNRVRRTGLGVWIDPNGITGNRLLTHTHQRIVL